ncbi:hypothetical protein NHX12_022512 [Muraenolepis orangiensis]|uniref:Uncharacterized protein n=1 Tax=Muraenolepis orangiensis TaxID=630683 RepID=A0A9Q0IU42_9TELE|nr:hypothetical protein NHX12_022512 [Muraenolepis orangiensis]
MGSRLGRDTPQRDASSTGTGRGTQNTEHRTQNTNLRGNPCFLGVVQPGRDPVTSPLNVRDIIDVPVLVPYLQTKPRVSNCLSTLTTLDVLLLS